MIELDDFPKVMLLQLNVLGFVSCADVADKCKEKEFFFPCLTMVAFSLWAVWSEF